MGDEMDWSEIERYLQIESPIDPSSLTQRRKRLCEEGVEPMLMATIKTGRKLGLLKAASTDRVIVDTTVIPKAVAHPTNSRSLDDQTTQRDRANDQTYEDRWATRAKSAQRCAGRCATRGAVRRRSGDDEKPSSEDGREICSARSQQTGKPARVVRIEIKKGSVSTVMSLPAALFKGSGSLLREFLK